MANRGKSNRDLVLENLAGFDRFDYEFVVDGYAPDGVLQFVMRPPLRGRENILAFFRKQFAPITETRIEVQRVVEVEDLVIVERIDHYKYDGIPVSCPVANFTELRDGKIALWREYFDRQQAAEQVRQGKARAK